MRRHGLFAVAVTFGVVLRVVVMVAYRPAMLFPDGLGYLAHADPFRIFQARPAGYSLFLRPFVLLSQSLTPIVTVQHLMGLGLAVLCYAFLVRRGLPGWGATLAVLPLLLDPLQLVLEHYVLSDLLFEVLLVGACLLLLWRRRPGFPSLVAAGVLAGSAGLVRGAGTFLLVVFVAALLCLRVRWTKILAFALAAVIPIAAYAVDFHRTYGEYAITTSGPRFLYGRLAPIVRCHDPQLRLPSYERMLCPRRPVATRPDTDWFMWGRKLLVPHKGADWKVWGRGLVGKESTARWHIWGPKQSPQWHVPVPPGMTEVQVVKDFDKRVVRAEPLVFARAALVDVALGFSPARTTEVPGYPASYWLFSDHYWSVDTFLQRHVIRRDIRQGTSYDPAAARFLTGYRQWVYAPGPLMAALLLLAAAATLGLGRARRCGDRVAIGLLAAACVLPLLTGAALSGFSWRYQLPQIPLLPMAGALGLAALLRGRPHGQPEPAPPLRVLDRAAARITGLPVPASWRPGLRRSTDRGTLQVAIAAVAGAVTACLSGVVGAASGWFALPTATVLGVVLGVLVTATLLIARRRAGAEPPPSAGEPTDAPQPDRPADELPTGH